MSVSVLVGTSPLAPPPSFSFNRALMSSTWSLLYYQYQFVVLVLAVPTAHVDHAFSEAAALPPSRRASTAAVTATDTYQSSSATWKLPGRQHQSSFVAPKRREAAASRDGKRRR
jgi:hypothetical protein